MALKKTVKVSVLLLFLSVFSAVVMANSRSEIARLDINIGGTVIASGTCTFISDSSQLIDFKDILFSNKNGGYSLLETYRLPVDVSTLCSGDTEGNLQMKVSTINGKDVNWQGERLMPVTNDIDGSTSTSLGIRLLADNQQQDINTWFTFDPQKPLRLEVELLLIGSNVKDFNSGTTISSMATLTIAFN